MERAIAKRNRPIVIAKGHRDGRRASELGSTADVDHDGADVEIGVIGCEPDRNLVEANSPVHDGVEMHAAITEAVQLNSDRAAGDGIVLDRGQGRVHRNPRNAAHEDVITADGDSIPIDGDCGTVGDQRVTRD